MNEHVNIDEDEKEAINYGKKIMGFYQELFAYVVCLIAFFAVFGFGNPILYWIFLGLGAGLAIQGLIAFEVIRFPLQNMEKRIVEKNWDANYKLYRRRKNPRVA